MDSFPPQRFKRLIWWMLLALLAFQVSIWLTKNWFKEIWFVEPVEPRSVTARGDLAESEKTTISIFELSSPSVVFISTARRVRDFWSRNVFTVPRGTGSGFIWDDQGHVVTNFHVIKGASEAKVRLNDGRSLSAVLVGASPAHDLAVLKINVAFDAPPPVPVGTSNELKVGQSVFAIGNPFGLDYTLTSGIVSALDRSITADNGIIIEHLIQTDAAINPGNSGGPLLDSAGRLIGINTAIYSPSGAYAGIGFAVPVDTVNRVIPELIAQGKYIRPSLGISVDESINSLLARQLGIDGVVILNVKPASVAERAHLQPATLDSFGRIVPGDILQAVDGKAVTTVADLLTRLNSYSLGDEVVLSVWRAGNSLDVTVRLSQ